MIERHRNANGTYDGLAVMGEVTGLGKPSMEAIWAEVKANQAKLDGCARHDFAPAEEAGLRARRTCRACGGWADPHVIRWYERGLSHGATA